jgi:hypothetical protein
MACVNQMGKTQSKPLASRYGGGTAWARHGMCELAFIVLQYLLTVTLATGSVMVDGRLASRLRG